MGDSVENIPVLAAIGVTESGARMVLGLQIGDKESAPTWRQYFKDLKGCGLDSSKRPPIAFLDASSRLVVHGLDYHLTGG
jgi:hypothetical protein